MFKKKFKQHFPCLANSYIFRLLYSYLKACKKCFLYYCHFLAFAIRTIFARLKYGQQPLMCVMAEPAIVGGTELQFKLLTTGLLNLGLTKVVLISGNIPGKRNNPYIIQMRKSGLFILDSGTLLQTDYRKRPFLCRCLALLFQILGIQLFHLFNPKCITLATIARKAMIKIVYMETGMPCKNAHWEPLIPYVTFIDQVISVSKEGLNCLKDVYHYTGPGIHINTMIETPPLIPQTRTNVECTFRIVYFGRFYSEKGIDILLQAFEKVANNFPSVHLTLIGDGPHRLLLEQTAAKLCHKERIRFIKPLDKRSLFAELANSDVFCLPSYSEGTPCSILEALAIKLPVIATQVGGIADIIQNQVTGILIPPKDTQALINAITQVISNPAQRKEMSEKGYLRYTRELTSEAALEKYITAYQSLLHYDL